MCKRIIIIVFLSFTFIMHLFSSNTNLDSIEYKIDSIFKSKYSEQESLYLKNLKALNEHKLKVLESENTYFKDNANWYLGLLGALLAIMPLSIGLIEFFKHKLNTKYNSINTKLKVLEDKTAPLYRRLNYSTKYIQFVIKPFVDEVISKSVFHADGKYDENVTVRNELDRFYVENEQCVNLLHQEEGVQDEAFRYLKESGTLGAIPLLELIIDEIEDSKMIKRINNLIKTLNSKYKK